jgi:O-antigen/teichoic acid export membrane protein
MILVASFVLLANRNESQTILVSVLFSMSLIFRALELMQCWFQCKLQAKYPSIVGVCAYVVVSAYKIILLVTQKSIYWFAVVNSIEYGIVGISLLAIYRKLGGQRLSVSLQTSAKLFKKSKYYVLAAMMVTVFQNTDHIMLKMIVGDAENGFYSAAITTASVAQFLYTAITDSMRPVILTCKKEESADYEKNISRLYCITTYMAVIQGVGFSIFAKPILQILYGEAYLDAVPVLRILVWYISFAFMGSVRNIWILAEGKQSIVWKLNLFGVVVNVVLNALLIPVLGAKGAATASLVTQMCTNFILGFFVRELKRNNHLLIKGLNPALLLELFQQWRK